MDQKEETSDIVKRRAIWFRYFLFWKRISWFLLIWIAVGSAVAASDPKIFGFPLQIISLTVSAAAAILATIQPHQRASAYRRAWIELDMAIKTEAGVPARYLQGLAAGERAISADTDRATSLVTDKAVAHHETE